jgi:hypothetical protein
MGTFENWTDSWTCDDDESSVNIDPIVKNIDSKDFNTLKSICLKTDMIEEARKSLTILESGVE